MKIFQERNKIIQKNIKAPVSQTSLTLKAAPPLESPSSFVKMAPVIPISMLNVVTRAVNSQEEIIKVYLI